MGTFNRVGFYSNLPIFYNDEVMVFICVMDKRDTFSDSSTPMYIDDIMFPVCMPVSCDYNDYGGGICNNRDANVEHIEKAFGGIDIDSIISILSYDSFEYKEEITEEYYKENILFRNDSDKYIKINDFMKKYGLTNHYMFTIMERKDVYDKMVKLSNKPFFDETGLSKYRIGNYWLGQLGFVEKDEDSYKYGSKYVLKDYDGEYYVSSSSIFARIMKDDMVVEESLNMHKLIDKWEELTGKKLEYNKAIEKYNIVDVSYDESKKAYEAKKIDKNKLTEIHGNEQELLNNICEDILDHIIKVDAAFNNLMHEMTDYSVLTDTLVYNMYMPLDVSYIGSMSCLHVPQSCCIYDADTIFQDSFKQIVCDFVRFNLTLSKMCGYYIFSSYGAQDMSDVDNLIDRLSLMRLFSNIVDERLKERIKDEEDNNFEWC